MSSGRMTKRLEVADIPQAMHLVWEVFLEFEAPDYSEEGVKEFKDFIDCKIQEKISKSEWLLWGCFEAGNLVGVIATRPPCHISLLFTDKRFHKQGVARTLLNTALDFYLSKGQNTVTVNSSPYAVGIYKRLNFEATDKEQTINGIRFTPMKKTFGQENFKLPIKAQNLYITEFTEDMAESVHLNSLDKDNRMFLPDEVFETVEKAKETISRLKAFYSRKDSPQVYPVVLNDGTQIGHIQAVPIDLGWEIGYHIAEKYTCRNYATEAVGAFLVPVMKWLGIEQIYGTTHACNVASIRVLEKNGFVLDFKGEDILRGKTQQICRFKYRLK